MVRMKNRSCSAPREAKNGAARATRIVAIAARAKIAEAFVRVSTHQPAGVASTKALLIGCARKEPARLDEKHGNESDMAEENLPLGIDRGAEGLRDPDDDAAGKGAPHRSEAANDDGLERVDEPRRTDCGIEIGARAEIERGDRGHDHRDAGCGRENPVRPYSHQAGGDLV